MIALIESPRGVSTSTSTYSLLLFSPAAHRLYYTSTNQLPDTQPFTITDRIFHETELVYLTVYLMSDLVLALLLFN